jgi:hypothetical protein
MRIIKISYFLLLYATFANAAVPDVQDINRYFNELQGTIGYNANSVKNTHKPLEELENLGIKHKEAEGTECTKDHCNVNQIFSSQATIKRQENLEANGFARDKDGNFKNNKGYLDKALKTVKNADKEFDYLKGSYKNCDPTSETITSKTETTCDQYFSMKENSCFPKQIVEIDPKYHYSCNKKREVKEKICVDTIKSIKCISSQECDMGGIEPGSLESDMKLVSSGGELIIGTISDNYWGGACNLYDKTTTFKVKNIHLIKDFTLFNVGFDDYMEILVNGNSVYAGPDGGKNLQIVRNSYVNNGISDQWCERNTNWNFGVNIDLKPYLKEGENNIRIRVIVSGAGEGWLKIRAKQNCCSSFQIERGEQCTYQ